jgi:hypothetical protein
LAEVMFLLSHGLLSRSPGIGGMEGTGAGGEHDRAPGGDPADKALVVALTVMDLDWAFSGKPAIAADQLDALALQPRQLGHVAPVVGHVVAAGERGRHVDPAGDRLRSFLAPRPAAASTSPGRISVLLGIHPRRSTRRRRAHARRGRRTSRRRRTGPQRSHRPDRRRSRSRLVPARSSSLPRPAPYVLRLCPRRRQQRYGGPRPQWTIGSCHSSICGIVVPKIRGGFTVAAA